MGIFRKFVKEINVALTPARITCTVRANLRIFMTISRSVLVRMRNVSGKIYREKKHAFNVQ